MSSLPPLDYFVAFEAAAKLGSFARASDQLHISETAISRKVRLLEQHYNIALFIRGHRSITLTDQGAELLQSVQKSLDLFKQLGVGLWAFNISSDTITKKFTPRPKKVLDTRRAAYVLDKACETHIHT